MTGGELFLVRHAEAAAGDDPGLSPAGRAQAATLGARLARRPVARVLHSPRLRATETAWELAASLPDVPVLASALLDDRTPVPSAERRGDYPDELQGWLAAVPAREQDVDGEFLTAALAALAGAVDAIPVVAVTHAFVIGWFVRCVLSAPPAAWTALAPDNTGVTVIDFSRGARGARLVAYNDTGHLS